MEDEKRQNSALSYLYLDFILYYLKIVHIELII